MRYAARMKRLGTVSAIDAASLSALTLVLACTEPPAETKASDRSEPAPSSGLLERFEAAKRQTTCIDAQLIANAVELHLVMDPSSCPTDVRALVNAKLLSHVPDSAPSWTIVCSGAEVIVSAPGADGSVGTSDDIVQGGPQANCKE
jgi:hypothetical protein